MNFIINTLLRKKKTKAKKENVDHENLNSSTAKSVLNFLSFGLTYGAESLRDRYKPSTKVNEFVAVSGQILSALKHRYDERFVSDSVVLSMHINAKSKQITLTQVGQNVMLVLDNHSAIITHTTLTELYANMRNDIIKHGEIYGEDLRSIATSFPAPD